MTSSSGRATTPRALHWFETIVSQLNHSHVSSSQLSQCISKGTPSFFAKSTDRPHRPPPGNYCFFVGQLEGGLRFSIPLIYFQILDFYGITINQLSFNAFRILVRAVIVFGHLEISLTPLVFHSLFQLKMVESGVFYFASRFDCQFLRGMPTSHKGWKSFYFFVRLILCLIRMYGRQNSRNFLH